MKIKLLIQLCIVLFFIIRCNSILFGQTNVSGIISTNTTWYLANSPYIVNGNILVNAGITLTIEPGVTIKFASEKSIQINGTLIANGNTDNKINFTSNQTNPVAGDWGSVYFTDNSNDAVFDVNGNYLSGTILNYCIIKYGGFSSNGQIKIELSNPYICNSTISNSSSSGFYLSQGGPRIFKCNIFENDNVGINVYNFPDGSTLYVDSCNIFKNHSHGVYAYFYQPTGVFTRNIITDNFGDGINIYNGTSIISENIIMHNNCGINIGDGSCKGATITKNLVLNNSKGLVILPAWCNTTNFILNNIFSNNNNTYIIGDGSTNTVYFNNNVITGCTSNSSTFEITCNEFQKNSIYNNIVSSSPGYSVIVHNMPSITNNNFISSNIYELQNTNPSSSGNLNATNNYWGTNSESAIQQKIYDWFDNGSIGIVDYSPFSSSPDTSAPMLPPINVNKTLVGNSIKVTFSPNGVSDLAGHKIYYGNPTGYSFSNVQNIGMDTSFIISGLTLSDTIGVTAYDNKADGIDDQVEGHESWFTFITKNLDSVEISIGSQTISAGDNFEIPISTSIVDASFGIISYQFDFEYNPTKIQYDSAFVSGTIAANGILQVNSAIAGHVIVGYISTAPIAGEGEIIKLNFTAIAEGTTPLTISGFKYNSTSITKINNGSVPVLTDNIFPTSAITYYNPSGNIYVGDTLIITATFSELMADSPVPQISLSGANIIVPVNMNKTSSTVYTYNHIVKIGNGLVYVALHTGTDLSGNLIISTPTTGGTFNVIPLRYGDVDDDGSIFAYDAALALQYSVGIDPLPFIDPLPWESWRIATANVDGVGSITAYDASFILQTAIGLITEFPVENTKKSGQINNVDVVLKVENNDIVFYSKGSLFGLNVNADNSNNNLGTPVILDNNMIKAFNIQNANYAIGVATAYSPADNTAFMKIPYKHSGSVTFSMIVNTEQKFATVDLATGIVEFSNSNIIIYPNPVTDNMTISGISKPTVANIYTVNGKLLKTSTLINSTSEINVNNLSNGVYIIKLQYDKEIAVKRFVKQ